MHLLRFLKFSSVGDIRKRCEGISNSSETVDSFCMNKGNRKYKTISIDELKIGEDKDEIK